MQIILKGQQVLNTASPKYQPQHVFIHSTSASLLNWISRLIKFKGMAGNVYFWEDRKDGSCLLNTRPAGLVK